MQRVYSFRELAPGIGPRKWTPELDLNWPLNGNREWIKGLPRYPPAEGSVLAKGQHPATKQRSGL